MLIVKQTGMGTPIVLSLTAERRAQWVQSAMLQLRGCPEVFCGFHSFTYNLQKSFLSLWKLRAGIILRYTSPQGYMCYQPQGQEPAVILLIIPVIAMPSIVLRK